MANQNKYINNDNLDDIDDINDIAIDELDEESDDADGLYEDLIKNTTETDDEYGDENEDDSDNKGGNSSESEEDIGDGDGRQDEEGEDGGINPEDAPDNDSVVISKSKAVLIKKLAANIKENTELLIKITSAFAVDDDERRISIGQMTDDGFKSDEESQIEGRVVEGVFDGESMIGPDGKQYSIPANYASKSKLVEGDIMKLTITDNGTFIYKQIGPIERNRIAGRLEKSPEGNYTVAIDGKRWKILTASVTYFRGNPGDEVIILVPKNGDSNWAAVENIIKDAKG